MLSAASFQLNAEKYERTSAKDVKKEQLTGGRNPGT